MTTFVVRDHTENTAVALKPMKSAIKFSLYRPVRVIFFSFLMIDFTALKASQRQIKAFFERVGFPYDLLLWPRENEVMVSWHDYNYQRAPYNFKSRVENKTVSPFSNYTEIITVIPTELRQPMIPCHQKNAV